MKQASFFIYMAYFFFGLFVGFFSARNYYSERAKDYESYYIDEMRSERELAGENYQLRERLKDSTFYQAIGRVIVKAEQDTSRDRMIYHLFVKTKNFNGHPDFQDSTEYLIPVKDFCNLMDWTPHRIRVKLVK